MRQDHEQFLHIVRALRPYLDHLVKVLTLRKRKTIAKQAKDALYIHDTLAMFGGSLAALREQAARVLERLAPKTRREFHALRVGLFENKALMIGAERTAEATGRAHPPSAETIGTICTLGLAQIFSS